MASAQPADTAATAEVDETKIITALRVKAERRDVPAARELREWLALRGREAGQTSAVLTSSRKSSLRRFVRGSTRWPRLRSTALASEPVPRSLAEVTDAALRLLRRA